MSSLLSYLYFTQSIDKIHPLSTLGGLVKIKFRWYPFLWVLLEQVFGRHGPQMEPHFGAELLNSDIEKPTHRRGLVYRFVLSAFLDLG